MTGSPLPMPRERKSAAAFMESSRIWPNVNVASAPFSSHQTSAVRDGSAAAMTSTTSQAKLNRPGTFTVKSREKSSYEEKLGPAGEIARASCMPRFLQDDGQEPGGRAADRLHPVTVARVEIDRVPGGEEDLVAVDHDHDACPPGRS